MSYIKSYQSYLKIERGLSKNTIDNYSFDIERLCLFLTKNEIVISPINIGEETVQQFIYSVAKEVNPRSQARIISGLKSFFSYLIFEDYRKDNPLELIETPKTGRKLPDTLSVEEIDNLIVAIDLTTNEGERNRAMLETLYGCGLRVSELVSLKVSDENAASLSFDISQKIQTEMTYPGQVKVTVIRETRAVNIAK